jgi:thiol-disulfide isomerase/thioredoxin
MWAIDTGGSMDLIRMLVLLPLMAIAQQAPLPGSPPEAPAAKADGPATRPSFAIAPDARQVLDDMGKAYHDLKHLQLAGRLRVDIKIDGEKPEQHDVKFTASFESPNKFRQEVPDEVLIGSTGTDVYSFKSKDKNYTMATGPKDRVALSEYPEQIAQSLTAQDISLALALSADPVQELMSDATGISKVSDTQIEDVKTVAPENAINYAWAPPAGAVDAAAAAMARANSDTPDGSDLLGKAAPAFKLTGLDGSEVSLASLKGKVVILDFWATWCGPCRMGLPKIDAVAANHKDDPMKVYAINLREDVDTVKQFVKSTKLGLPVLMDSEGKTADTYGAQAIPFTVIIAPDGKVVKVFVGYDPNESEEIEKVIKPLLQKAGAS